MHLLTPIYSHMNPSHCYVKMNDEVIEVADHGEVKIVRGKDNQVFSVNVNQLSDDSLQQDLQQLMKLTEWRRNRLKNYALKRRLDFQQAVKEIKRFRSLGVEQLDKICDEEWHSGNEPKAIT